MDSAGFPSCWKCEFSGPRVPRSAAVRCASARQVGECFCSPEFLQGGRSRSKPRTSHGTDPATDSGVGNTKPWGLPHKTQLISSNSSLLSFGHHITVRWTGELLALSTGVAHCRPEVWSGGRSEIHPTRELKAHMLARLRASGSFYGTGVGSRDGAEIATSSPRTRVHSWCSAPRFAQVAAQCHFCSAGDTVTLLLLRGHSVLV